MVVEYVVGESLGPDVDAVGQVEVSVRCVVAEAAWRKAHPRPRDQAIPQVVADVNALVLVPVVINEVSDVRPAAACVAAAPITDQDQRLLKRVQ